eukprot:8429107-Lingulodinium_polyedra.AAC.1
MYSRTSFRAGHRRPLERISHTRNLRQSRTRRRSVEARRPRANRFTHAPPPSCTDGELEEPELVEEGCQPPLSLAVLDLGR